MNVRYSILFITILLFSCTKEEDRIPDAYVNYTITLQEFGIKSKNGVLVVNKQDGTGVSGLIIYRRPDNTYAAYDRCSSVNPSQRCAVVPDEPNLTATDPCSGAKFLLSDGSPVKAPAKRPLREYGVRIAGFTMTITN